MASTATPAPAIEPKPLQLRIKPGFAWHDVLSKAVQVAPEAFSDQGHFLNLIEGSWGTPGHPRSIASPIDGSIIGKLPMIDLPDGLRAVRAAAKEGTAWAKVS
ncbi:MAG: aldehyde dehydrogenase, partial [Phycisphaerae bacterium]